MLAAVVTFAEQHRRAQLQLRAHALRDYMLLWPLWKPGDDTTFPALVAATLPIVRAYHQLSATLAGSYFEAARVAEQVPGSQAAQIAPVIEDGQVAGSLYVTGQVMNRDALNGGRTNDGARQAALVRTSGAVTRHLLSGGRDTILGSVQADTRAVGWARVTDGNPCAFCLTLASRGAVYKTEQTASFEAHDHCGCQAMPIWRGTALPPETERWRSIYEQAQTDAIASGDLQPGENSSHARLNAVRRYLAQP